jgi:hypothetical protein
MPRVKLNHEIAKLDALAEAAPDHVLARGYRERATELRDQHPQVTDDALAEAGEMVRGYTKAAARSPVVSALAGRGPLTRTGFTGMIYKTG